MYITWKALDGLTVVIGNILDSVIVFNGPMAVLKVLQQTGRPMFKYLSCPKLKRVAFASRNKVRRLSTEEVQCDMQTGPL